MAKGDSQKLQVVEGQGSHAPEDVRVTLSEILASLSHATDLVEGQPKGHALRTAYLADHIAAAYQLPDADRNSLYFAALLKDTGCSTNSARVQKVFGGDEILAKQAVKFIDWSSTWESLKYGAKFTEPGGTIGAKLRRIAANLGPPQRVMQEVTLARCTRGALIVRSLGFDEVTANAVNQLDEHWDGKGAPYNLKKEAIHPVARILSLAQTLEVFITAYGVKAGMEMLQQRQGRWFDPEVVKAALTLESNARLWEAHSGATLTGHMEFEIEAAHRIATEADIDQICQAYASIVDAKSSFTAEHSSRVTRYALEIALYMGLDYDRIVPLRRAGLLHDIGKLGVSNQILEKPGRLTDEEFQSVRNHPRHTEEILKPIKGFARITEIAAAHHERLDGKGYFKGLTADQLDDEMRILLAADIFDALSAERPYRAALKLDEVFEIMDRDAGTAIDPRCIEALKATQVADNSGCIVPARTQSLTTLAG